MYRLISMKNQGKKSWYYYKENFDASCLVLHICEGCESKGSAKSYVERLQEKRCLVKSIGAGMYAQSGPCYEKRRQFGKSVYKATLDQKKYFLNEINKDFGERPIQEIMEKEVEDLLLKSEKSGSWKNSYLETFLDIYKEARWNGIDVTLPRFQKFKRGSRKADVLTEAEIQALFAPGVFSNKALELMFELGLSCGLRLGEMRGVRVGQVIFENGALVVDGFINKMGERTNYNKKGSAEKPKFRVAFLPQKLLEKIKAFIAEKSLLPGDYLFQRQGRPFCQSYAYKTFLRAAKRAGINFDGRKIVPHSLRYTYITRMRSFLPGETVRKLAGHSSVEMTDYYTRASLRDLIEELSPTQASVERCIGEALSG